MPPSTTLPEVDYPAIRRLSTIEPEERRRLMRRSLDQIFDPALWTQIESLFEDVELAGDSAVCAALERYDGVRCEVGDLTVTASEIAGAGALLSVELRDAIDLMIAQLRGYNERIVRDATWSEQLGVGTTVGERALPIASCALYVPCGKNPFPSVMAHLCVPAVVAGVPHNIVLCPPLRSTGQVDPAYLYIASVLGIETVIRCNGPAGIAAATLGTNLIPRVHKVVGPGSPAVTVAQLIAQQRGVVTNMLQGPSESLVIADAEADLALLAADLVTEAEHGDDSAVTLCCWDAAFAERVADAVRIRIAALPEPQRGYAASSLSRLGGILICADEAEACAFAHEYAPEHLQIATADPQRTFAAVGHAAETLIGQTTPMSVANFTIGIPNSLPSGGYAAVSSGITARTFLAISSTAALTAEGLARLAPAARVIAEHEDFPAHAAAIRERGL